MSELGVRLIFGLNLDLCFMDLMIKPYGKRKYQLGFAWCLFLENKREKQEHSDSHPGLTQAELVSHITANPENISSTLSELNF